MYVPFGDTNERDQTQWINCLNVSDETIPPFSCVQVASGGTENQNGRDVLLVEKPDNYGAMPMCFVTDGHAISVVGTAGPVRITANGISAYPGSATLARGFTIGSVISESGDDLYYIAMRTSSGV